MKRISYILILSVSVLVTIVFFNDFNFMYSDQRMLVGFDNITTKEDFNLIEGLFSPKNAGHSMDDFVKDTQHFMNTKGYEGFFRFETTDESSGNELRHVLLSDGLYQYDVFSHLSFKVPVEINNETVITDDLSMKDHENTIIIDYLDHEYYNKVPFTNSYLYVMSLKKHKIPDNLGTIAIAFFTEPENIDILYEEMVDYFAKYSSDIHIELALTVRNKDTYKSGLERRNIWNSYYLPPYSILVITMVSVLAMALLITFYNSKEIALRYLHGHSEVKILQSLYLNYYLTSLGIYLTGVLATAFILTDSYSSLFKDFLMYLMPVSLIFMGCVALTIVFTYGILKYKGSVSLLKTNFENTLFFVGLSSIKFLMVIMLIIPTTSDIQELKHSSEWYQYTQGNEMFKNISTLPFMGLSASSEDDKENLLQLTEDYMEENHMGYADLAFASIGTYGYFEGKELDLKHLIVNQTYLNAFYPNSESSKKQMLGDITYLVIPESQRHMQPYYTSLFSEYAIEYVDTLAFTEIIPKDEREKTKVTDPVVVVSQNPLRVDVLQNNWSNSIISFNGIELLIKMKDLYPDNYTTNFTYLKVADYVNTVGHRINLLRNSVLQQLFLMAILGLIYAYSIVAIYTKTNAKKMSIQYTMGYSFMRRYATLLAVIVITNIALINIGIKRLLANHLPIRIYHLFILFGFLILDILFIYLHNKKIKNHSVNQLIKGAEL